MTIGANTNMRASSGSGALAGSLSLRANFSWTLAATITQASARWLMLLAMAKIGGPVMVGQFALGLFIVEPVIMLSDLQLRGVLASDTRREYRFADYMALRLATCLLAVVIVGGTVLFAGYRGQIAAVIIAVAVWRALGVVSNLHYGLFQRHERLDIAARSLIGRSVLGLTMLTGAIYASGDLLWGVGGLIFVGVVALVGHDIRAGSRILARHGRMPSVYSPGRSTHDMMRLALLALPVGIAGLFASFSLNVPRYVIEGHFGERELGLFAAMVFLVEAGNMVIGAIAAPTFPRLARAYARGYFSTFGALLGRLVAIGLALGVAGVTLALLAGRELLTFVYRPEFAAQPDVFAWIMLAGGIGYVASFLGYGVTATRQFKRLTIPYVLVALFSVAVSLLLVPRFGLLGAAWAMGLINTTACAAPLFVLLTGKGSR